MGCKEVALAMEWSAQSTNSIIYGVNAYLTMHNGSSLQHLHDQGTLPDQISCASGPVWTSADHTRLEGHLTAVSTLHSDGSVRPNPRVSVWVEIDPDGTLGYQPRLDGKPIGGMPAAHFPAANINDVLLSAVHLNAVYTVGVNRLSPAPPDVIPK